MVACLYIGIGFFGYLKFGPGVQPVSALSIVRHNRHHHQQYHNTIVNSLNSQSLAHLSQIVARKPIIITTNVLIVHLSNTNSNYPVDTLVTGIIPDSDP